MYLMSCKVVIYTFTSMCLNFVFFSGNCGSIVVCISPLTSLMLDQRAQYSPKGLNVEFVGEAQTDLCLVREES